MAYKIKLTYLDGTVDEVIPTPRARIETERHFGGLQPKNAQESTLYLAWVFLTKAGKVAVEFDAWVDSLADVDELQVDDVRPTQPAQPAASSSD